MEICSLIVYCKPEHIEAVMSELKLISNVDIIDHAPTGKIVIVVESSADKTIAQLIDEVQFSKYVLSVMLVYQHSNV